MGFEEVMKDIDKVEARLKELESFKEKAQLYAQKFVDKVESGRARSRETYADMQDLLKD